jgi:hypothetical protein
MALKSAVYDWSSVPIITASLFALSDIPADPLFLIANLSPTNLKPELGVTY